MARKDSYEKFLERFAANLKRIRRANGLTQEQMAERGFNYRFYQKLESGSYSPTLKTLHRVASALGVKVEDLVK